MPGGRTWQADALGSVVGLEAWTGAWSFSYWLVSCPRYHRYIKGNQKKKMYPQHREEKVINLFSHLSLNGAYAKREL